MALAPPCEQLFEGTQEGNGCPSAVAAQGRGEGQGRGWAVSQVCMALPRPPLTHAHVLRARPFRNGVPQKDVSALCTPRHPRGGPPSASGPPPTGAHRDVREHAGSW